VTVVLRTATHADIPMLEELIARSARGLSTADYRSSQIEGALRGAFGVDTQLLKDQTYFVAEEDGLPAGCGESIEFVPMRKELRETRRT